jgi:hypothetical protein
MAWVKRATFLFCALLIVAVGQFLAKGYVSAQSSTRQTTLVVEYTEYEWWLIDWASGQIQCQIFLDHEGLPTIGDVSLNCGNELATNWQNTPACQDIQACSGYYVHLAASQPASREMIINMPPATVWLDMEGCSPVPPENLCTELPILTLTAEEPLPEEHILAIQGTIDGVPFYCAGDRCQILLLPTAIEGSTVQFWADSSFGDSSKVYTAHVRVVDTGYSPEPGGSGYYVDIVSSQWKGTPLSSCARIWEAFPPIGGTPAWLSTPSRHELIASENPYYYLAGRLIFQGLVDASYCPSNGLLPNGYANACGLEQARPLVEEWQNQFDAQIIEAANKTGIPAQLMKNLFAQESQFWPGVFRVPNEFGLGQLTDSGTDAVLLWNTEFYTQFCPLVLSKETCNKGYLGLTADEQSILRGALALQAKTDCPECATGVDLTNTNFTVLLFANTLQANCSQISRTIYTATTQMAGRVSTYEDLWRFTIANYHAGPGCVSYAIHQAWLNTGQLNWGTVSANFTEPCQGVIPYVEKITK